MDIGVDSGSPEDIQTQVLQTTLNEIESSRQDRTGSASGNSKDSDCSSSSTSRCCVVCLESVSEPCAALPCGHDHFDFLCLVSWLQEHPNCPLCKANVYKVRYTDGQKADAIYRVPNAPRTRDKSVGDGDGSRATEEAANSTLMRRRFAGRNGFLREASPRHPRPPPTEDEAVRRRRHIYRHQLYSLHVGSNRISQYRPAPTAVQFASTPHLVSRARLWIRRELQVFPFLSDTADDNTSQARRHSHNAEFLLEYIVAILKTVDLQGSTGQAEAMLADFLGPEHARLFLHELRTWLRSPAVGLAAWDREVQYPDPDRHFSPVEEVEREYGDGEREYVGDRRDRGSGRGQSWRDRDGDHWRADGRGKKRKRNTAEPKVDHDGKESRLRRETLPDS
ncbi:uncharacterized protein C8A04DRAFT_15863 [Dichotomopilus funicola]|uniref:RING-type E3 ubiquitin transferase n=1 Tax=Dichotomopilus funicola TaxID=1934379 RepID=A0AAN6UUG0_9PEZI|nr:hypothetical protein C8A04DRAFT_15863 [Dichotomopilus funicola]